MKKIFSRLVLMVLLFSLTLTAYASPITVLGKGEMPSFSDDAEVMKIYFFNIFARDSFLVQCGGKNMLIDCGEMDYGRLYIAPSLKALGVDHIDVAVNTHPDDDHIGGFFSLVDLIPIDKFYTCFPADYCDLQRDFLKLAEKKNIPVEWITEDTDLSFGGISIWTFQNLSYPKSPNACSLVMHLTYGESTAILLSDIPYEIHHILAAEKGDALRADLIKVPHHGYNTPCLDLMDCIQPKYAIITHWRYEKIMKTVSMLSSRGCPTVFSAEGIVEFSTDGNEWQMRQFKVL